MNAKSLHQFRDFASLLFRVANTGPNHIGNAHSFHSDVDRLLTMHMLVLEERDTLSMDSYRPIPIHFGVGSENDNINEFCAREIMRPPTPPTLVIHHDQRGEEIVPNVVVTKDEPEIKTVVVKNAVVNNAVISEEDNDDDSAIVRDLNLGDGDDIESVVPEESEHEATEAEEEVEEAEEEVEEAEEEVEEAEEEVEEAEEEVEEAEEEVEEAEEEVEEEEEGMEIIKVKKKTYFCGEHSKKVYEYIDDESAGDCLGVLKDGRIVPLE